MRPDLRARYMAPRAVGVKQADLASAAAPRHSGRIADGTGAGRMIDTPSRAALATIGIALLVMGLKFLAWGLTGSVAFYSDAVESIVNVVAAVVALAAVRVSARPADANHPFGHQKAEFLSATLEGALILVAAGLIVWEAGSALLDRQPIEQPGIGIAVIALAMLVNAVWAMALDRWGRRWRSPALRADARHLWVDVASSAGVVAGVAIIPVTGWWWLDPLLAAAVAVNVVWSGMRIVRESLGGLMDEMVDGPTLARIAEVVAAHADGAVQAHDLKARSLGRGMSVEFHLVVPGAMSVDAAHVICDRIEAALKPELGEGHVVIHVEPEHKAKAGAIVPTRAA
jgi:cation diffusion facilitator family transporter